MDRRDPLGEGRDPRPLAGEPEFDPATDAFRPDAINPDPNRLRGEARVDEVEVTRVEIERTRADMSETVDAIQRRLNPETLKEQARDRLHEVTEDLKDQAKDRAHEATVGRARDAGSGITETIRENPLPAALTGIGLGWLLVSARKQRAQRPRIRRRRPYYDHDYPPAHDAPYDYPPRYDDERESGGPSAGRQALEQTRDKVGETAVQARDTVGQSAAQVRDKTSEIADRTQEQASRLANRAQYQARRAGGGLQRMLRENPLTTGALALGLGAAVGLAIPETRKEHEVMGEARDTVVEKAQEKAQEAQQKVQRVAVEAQGAAKEEAQNQGLVQE